MSLVITNEKTLKSGHYWVHFRCSTKKCAAYGDIRCDNKAAALDLFGAVAMGHTCEVTP